MPTLHEKNVPRCESCGAPLVRTPSGWLACYWLDGRLKSEATVIEALAAAGWTLEAARAAVNAIKRDNA